MGKDDVESHGRASLHHPEFFPKLSFSGWFWKKLGTWWQGRHCGHAAGLRVGSAAGESFCDFCVTIIILKLSEIEEKTLSFAEF